MCTDSNTFLLKYCPFVSSSSQCLHYICQFLSIYVVWAESTLWAPIAQQSTNTYTVIMYQDRRNILSFMCSTKYHSIYISYIGYFYVKIRDHSNPPRFCPKTPPNNGVVVYCFISTVSKGCLTYRVSRKTATLFWGISQASWANILSMACLCSFPNFLNIYPNRKIVRDIIKNVMLR